MRRCALYDAGTVGYQEGLAIQAEARSLVACGAWDGLLILLEHRPVITIGRSGGRGNLLADPQHLAAEGIEVVESERGGNVTCHNPGQLVGYPVLDLSLWRQDVHWYVQSLEEVLIGTLSRLGLEGGRRERYTGVWLGEKKVAAIGVYVRDWVTSHGFALNVDNDLGLFDRIVPCGIKEFGVTSLARQGCTLNRSQVATLIGEVFAEVFACTLSPLPGLDGGTDRFSRLPARQEVQVHG